MRSWKCLFLLVTSTLYVAAQSDRIVSPVDPSQVAMLPGNVHGLARAEFDQGRADGSRVLSAVSLIFKPSAAQQRALNTLLAQQQDLTSANYHKWLTPAQFADRFGVSQNDINKVVAWLQSQGLTVTRIANGRNQIFIEGTIAQIESTFHTEIHNYLVNGVLHYANSTEPGVPAALAGVILAVQNLHNFQPKPRAIVRKISQSVTDPHFTSYISGDHFVAPGDFATMYDVAPLYTAGTDGTGQKIVLTGQSSINLADVANFRSAAGLSANVPTLLLEPSTGTSTRCPGDEGESDLDVEWSGAIAKNASITLVYAGLAAGDTCTNRQFGAFDALQYSIDQNLAPIISNSYGNCESIVGQAEADTMQGWIQQANSQGQTVMSASGDSGAADCDFRVKSATQGLAVDIPAAIPEVTAMGGTEFEGDPASTSTTTYWTGTTGSTDTISSALSYIPETGWNDTTNPNNTGGDILASGGGASIFFAKPSWQTGTGVPNDGKRDLPDLALNASPDHDPYLFCSEDGPNGTVVASCTSGFRTGAGGDLTAVGGTSAAAPTFAGIVALLNQYLVTNGFQTTPGLGNINPTLYHIATYNPTAMNDVTTGNNFVPCVSGTTDCPASLHFGFSAGAGYDQVTGLGSINANSLANDWGELFTRTTTSISTSATTISGGSSVTFTATVTPSSATGVVSFYVNSSTTALGTASVSSGTAVFITTSLPVGANSITATYNGINASSTSSPTAVTVTAPFTISAVPASLTVSAGQTGPPTTSAITIVPAGGFTGTVTFTNSAVSSGGSCSGLPAGALCSFNPASITLNGTSSAPVGLTISTAANMALPKGPQTITVTGISGSAAISTTLNLTVTKSTETFTLSSTAATFPIGVGGTVQIPITVSSSTGFINSSNSTTVLPLTYSCSGIPVTAEISCQVSGNDQPTNASSVTVTLVTTPVTTELLRPPFGGSRIFYALLLPGLFGFVFVRPRRRGVRLLSLIIVLGFSTLWLGSCGGNNNSNNSLKNAGTPPGNYVVTISATTGGPVPLTNSNAPFSINLAVSSQ